MPQGQPQAPLSLSGITRTLKSFFPNLLAATPQQPPPQAQPQPPPPDIPKGVLGSAYARRRWSGR